MEAIEAVRNAHQDWLSRHPDATAQQLFNFLARTLNDLKAWPRIIPLSTMINQMDHEAAIYLKAFGEISASVGECQANIEDDIEAVECLIEEQGAEFKVG